MNKYQTEVEKQLLENEKEILEKLKNNYATALNDVKQRIKDLQSNELTQSKIYQLQYQKKKKKQLQAITDLLSADNVNDISDYLNRMYQDGFIGTFYNMQNEGIPFIMPIDQQTIIKSISKKTEDFQLSKTLYKNAEELKKVIISEITRGISQGLGYSNISKKIASHSEADLKKAYRIARTEGGRVQTEAKFEAMKKAKENGADVVKQWDSTIDTRTRKTHIKLDGQTRELDEPFEVDGDKAMYPHGFGIAEEDINCRCALLERARWAVNDNDEFIKNIDGDIVQFENIKDYKEYKEKYFDFYKNRDKISKTRKEGIEKVRYIGDIDETKLGKFKNKIITKKVVLTKERIQHIQKRHPGDYEKYSKYLPDILKNPDYILEDKEMKDTVLMLKTLQEDNKNIQVVIKLITEIEDTNRSNSIITFWHIRERNYRKLIDNGKIIYSKLDKNE